MNRQIANKWFAAFNEHNLESLLALYNDKAQHYSPKLKAKYPDTNGFVTGKSQLRKWWAESFETLPSLQYIPEVILVGDNQVFEYLRKADGQPDILVGELLQIENGLIVKSKVYHS